MRVKPLLFKREKVSFSISLAQQEDIPNLISVMDRAIYALQADFLSPEAVKASYEVMGLDSQLVEDQTYFKAVHTSSGALMGCGGWSFRETLFGGDHSQGRSARLLDPASEPARVRAMYTDPDHVRCGVGRKILAACEAAAQAGGFRSVELVATLAGAQLYSAAGYQVSEEFDAETVAGTPVPLRRMIKSLA